MNFFKKNAINKCNPLRARCAGEIQGLMKAKSISASQQANKENLMRRVAQRELEAQWDWKEIES